MTFSAQTRKETIETLKKKKLDLLIIGGGITGAGLALQGAARDMDVGLVEMQDFAAGTSSRSSKLVHGGLRYLKQFDVELVADVAKEREVIGGNAPHIAQPSYMMMPVYDEPGASFNKFTAEVVLHLYDYLAEVDEKWAHYLVEKEEVLKEEPSLKEEGLLAGGFYLDYTNDDARLTIENIKKAHELGALITNYVKAEDFLYHEDNTVKGIKAKDTLSGESFEIEARLVVNAAGPWSDEVRKNRKGEAEEKMYPTKGVHFVVEHSKLPVSRTIYTDSGQEDNRMIFIIPRGGKTYFGTTDTPYEGVNEEPSITREDVDYLLKAVNHRFKDIDIKIEDIESSWSGLRPLIQDENNDDPSGISRGHEIFSEEDGLITIAGGKLTDYRRMAEDAFEVIDERFAEMNMNFRQVDTSTIRLSGGDVEDPHSFDQFIADQIQPGLDIGLTKEDAQFLADWYGSNITKVYSLKDKAEQYNLPLKDALQLAYGLEYEMVMAPEDFLGRRTDTLLFAMEKLSELEKPVLDVLEKELNWTEQERAEWQEHLTNRIADASLSNLKSD
ncbi:FAD-dependent oxidoreductase [Alkalibacterium sp.]|nr:MAG: glycerol-3-phosphate dehydrogenase/oxidase [Alkalibacterium sp.]